MDIRWSVSESHVLGMDEGFNVVRCFVVNLVQSRFETASCECIVRQCVGAKQLFLLCDFLWALMR
jgi:hypothetical protein